MDGSIALAARWEFVRAEDEGPEDKYGQEATEDPISLFNLDIFFLTERSVKVQKVYFAFQ